MASIRERVSADGKKSFHVQVRLQGFPPQTKTFDTKTEAKRWAQYVETELRAGRYMPVARAQRRTVKDMLEEYRQRVLIPLKPKRVRDQGRNLTGGSRRSATTAWQTSQRSRLAVPVMSC